MGRLSDWSDRTRAFIAEKSRLIFGALQGGHDPTGNLSSSLGRIKALLYILIGVSLSALLIEVSFQHFVKAPPRRGRLEIAQKRLHYLEARASYNPILQKNIFCPGCPIPDLEARKIDRPKDCNRAERLGGGVKLIGTIALDNPQYSVATVVTSGPAKSYKVGERLGSYGTVYEIRRDRICILRGDDKLAYIELPGIPKFDIPGTPSASTIRSTIDGISQISETDFEVKRDYLMKSLTDMSVLQTAYATPYFEDNEIKGFRIQSIDPGSPLLALGFKPQDILLKVDNQPLNSLAKAQEILAGAATLESLSITVQRNGQDTNLNYKVSK